MSDIPNEQPVSAPEKETVAYRDYMLVLNNAIELHGEVAKLKAKLATARNEALEGFLALADDHSQWSQSQFGTDDERGPEGPLAHLAKEVVEMTEAPKDPMEYADGLLLLLDAARRAGIPASVLLATAWEKLSINKERNWGDPNADGSVEHVRALKETTNG